MPKRYTVTGSQPVLDHKPGESFEAEIPRDEERFLVSIGALTVEVETQIKRLTVESHKRDADRR